MTDTEAASKSSRRRSLLAGFALAALITSIYCAERLDAAARVVESLRLHSADAVPEFDPIELIGWWLLIAVISAVLGGAIAHRFLVRFVPKTVPCRKLVVGLAYAAVAFWFAWQVSGMLALDGWERPRWVAHGLYWPASGCAAAALLLGGRDLFGRLEWRSTPLVRVHLIFLFVLFVLVFRAPFTSDQLTDVLRGWGDGPRSRALAGLASVLLLGAVIRGSSRRLLIATAPRESGGGLRTALAERVPERLRIWWEWASGKLAACRRWASGKLAAGRTWASRKLAACPDVARGLALALGALLLLAALKVDSFGPLLFVAVAAAFLALTTHPVGKPLTTPANATDESKAPFHRLSGTLGIAPLGILVVGLVGATTDSLLLPDSPAPTDVRLLVGTVVVVVLFGLLAGTAHLPLWSDAHRAREPRWLPGSLAFVTSAGFAVEPAVAAELLLALTLVLAFRGLGARGKAELWAAGGAFVGLGLAVYVDPIGVPKAVGAFGVAMFGAAGLMTGLHALGHVAARREMRLPWAGPRSAPVLTLLVLWLLVALVNGPGDVHRARTVPAPDRTAAAPADETDVTIEQAVRDWLAIGRSKVGSSGADPMLIVAASGGGSKAAYWTDLVLDCAFGAGVPRGARVEECAGAPEAERRRASLFLTSSVSGGSIGIHHLLERFDDAGGDEEWVEPTAGQEVLSPLVAWGLFHDLPAFLVGLPTDPRRCDEFPCRFDADRAVMLEATMTRKELGGRRLLDRTTPIPIFNATVGMLGWRRAMLSRLSLARVPGCPPEGGPVAGAFDGHDLLDDEDVPMITAALLSARFPALLPSARFGTAEKGEGCDVPTHPDVQIRDGGLIENTGLMTIADLMPSILAELARHPEAKVMPIVVSIDDDVPDMGRDNEYADGFIGGLGLESSRDNTARARDTLIDRCEEGGLVYLRISPAPHVGAQAATGWEVSETSRRKDLVKSLQSGEAADDVARLQALLDGSPGDPAKCRS